MRKNNRKKAFKKNEKKGEPSENQQRDDALTQIQTPRTKAGDDGNNLNLLHTYDS